jgi:predicted nucleotidyltransferase
VTDFAALLDRLRSEEVAFIIVGGVAATIHGSTRLTQDLDVVYDRSPANLDRLVEALSDVRPYPRGAPPGLPFEWSTATLRRGLNFTLTTTIGDIDLFGEVAGGGRYDDLLDGTIEVEIFEGRYRCVDLERLIALKRAAGRPRDFETIAELEIVRDSTVQEEDRAG